MLDVLAADFVRVLGVNAVVTERAALRTYECDGLTAYRCIPGLVVLPETTAQVSYVVRRCHELSVPFVARGAGTGLSGGALPVETGVLIVLSRMTEVRRVDIPDERAVVQPGVVNLELTRRAAPHGYFYAPDPSSQQVCSIGGNVAENSGGAHCLKYGFTVHHVLGVEAVLPNGELIHAGGPTLDRPGLDLLGVLVGSEGTLAVVTKATLRAASQLGLTNKVLATVIGVSEATVSRMRSQDYTLQLGQMVIQSENGLN